MSSVFTSKLPSVTLTVEAQHLLGFRLSGSHPAVRVHGFRERNDLDRQWFQSTRVKPQPKLVFDFPICRDLSP